MNKKSLLLAGVAAFALTSAATAADLMVEAPPAMVYDEPAPAGNWDGPYIGAFGGWGWGIADHIPDGGPCAPDGCDVLMDGWLAGVVVGANFTLSDNIVGGVAADIAWSGMTGTDTFGFIGDSTNSVDWEGSLRGVLGYDGGTFMPYLTAGLAVASASHTSDFVAPTTATAMHLGGTVGAGVQVAVAENVALDLQYRASFYNDQVYDVGAGPFNPVFALHTHRITAGINVGF